MQSAKKGSSKWRAALAANEVQARVSVCVLTYGYGSGRVQRTPARCSRQQPSLSIWAPLVRLPFLSSENEPDAVAVCSVVSAIRYDRLY